MTRDPGIGRSHWDNVWSGTDPATKSWFQGDAAEGADQIADLIPTGARVIDVGAGTSLLADELVMRGYEVTVLDISDHALDLLRKRIDDQHLVVDTVCADVTEWRPDTTFDLWHDRAVLHFLDDDAADAYAATAAVAIRSGGHAIISGFALDGPEQCSGLDVVRRSRDEYISLFGSAFELIATATSEHITPWDTPQRFLTVTLRRL